MQAFLEVVLKCFAFVLAQKQVRKDRTDARGVCSVKLKEKVKHITNFTSKVRHYFIKMGLLHLYCNKLTSTTNFSSCNYVQPCPCLLFGLHDIIEWPSDDLPSVLTSSSEKRPQFRFCCMHYHSSFSIVLSKYQYVLLQKRVLLLVWKKF